MSKKIYEIKIQLDGSSKPPIWRKVLVAEDANLVKLHYVIQAAMGWYCSHLHHFIINGSYFSEPSPLGDDGFSEFEDSNKVKIGNVFGRLKSKIKYEYDFGDGWQHTLTLEAIHDAEPKAKYPQLIAGKGACPPEDCGGIYGYEELKATLADPESEDYEDMVDWLELEDGSEFDPNEFDLAEHQAQVANLA